MSRSLRPGAFRWVAALAVLAALGGCGDGSDPPEPSPAVLDTTVADTAVPDPGTPDPAVVETAPGPTSAAEPETEPAAAGGATPRPAWLGTRVLPIDPATGYGEVQPTPPELVDRRLETPPGLPPPSGDGFAASVVPVPDAVLARSTWSSGCPVPAAELRYVTLPFLGFDGRAHTGELLVHADAVDAMVAGFGRLYERRFPIEEMRIVTVDELDLPPTGDGNNTTAFVCRPTRGSTSWSQHASGRAVDINPFHNPYTKGAVVLPELASSYVDRSVTRSGMLTAADVAAFVDAGWGWGGTWSSPSDPMHVSANGR